MYSAYILFVESNAIKKMNLDGTGVETIYFDDSYSIVAFDYHYRLVKSS